MRENNILAHQLIQAYANKQLSFQELVEDMDDAVEAWHNGHGENVSLQEYLGLTRALYEVWVLSSSQAFQECLASYSFRQQP